MRSREIKEIKNQEESTYKSVKNDNWYVRQKIIDLKYSFSHRPSEKNYTVQVRWDKNHVSPNIPVGSPLYSLQFLKTGWDGYWAEPLSLKILLQAHQLWLKITQRTNTVNLPTVQPAANGSVAFTWSHHYPKKELEIWLFDQPDYYAEWMLIIDNKDKENTSQSEEDLLTVIEQYLEG